MNILTHPISLKNVEAYTVNHYTKLASLLATFTLLMQSLPFFQTPPSEPQDLSATSNVYLPFLVSIPGPTGLPPGNSGEALIVSPRIIQISNSEPELVNPMRGLHEWRNNEVVPLPETSFDAYQRYFWHDPDKPSESLETSRGVYNFSELEKDITAAAAKGKKFAIRIRAMASESSNKRYIPDYLSTCGWSHQGTFIPDWNSSCFLDNAANLIKALGDRYDKDPRIAWIEVGLYGRWGEWAMSEEIYGNAPSGKTVISDSSMNRIVDMHLSAFPTARKVMMAKTRSSAVVRALASSNQVGWRVDCLGKPGYFDFHTNSRYKDTWEYMQDRWKTAPVIAEFCNGGVDESYVTAMEQVRDWHITTVGNGNFDSWGSKSSQQKNNLSMVGKIAGYRFQIKTVTTPKSWRPGSSVSISAVWENTGNAPHYERASVVFKLYDPNAQTYVWEAASSLNLRALLPTEGRPVTTTDQFTVPAGLRSGSYQLRVIVTDPAGFRKPLKLAIAGRQSDGSYLLGNIDVR